MGFRLFALATVAGSITDPAARIAPFKYHEATLPIDKAGAKQFFRRGVTDVGWIETERYMGIFHEVVPAKNQVRPAVIVRRAST